MWCSVTLASRAVSAGEKNADEVNIFWKAKDMIKTSVGIQYISALYKGLGPVFENSDIVD